MRKKNSNITGKSNRLRFAVFRSNKHIYAQIVDDLKGQTLVSASTMIQSIKNKIDTNKSGNCEAAALVGAEIAKLSISQGIKKVVFDRGSRVYHGRIKSLADSARKEGLEF